MVVNKQVNPHFNDFIFDWDYTYYLLVGAYGSSKSYHVALKIILKLLKEKRKCLVVRDVYETLKESCFDIMKEILEELNLLYEGNSRKSKTKVIAKENPMEFVFPNGSRVIFKGMDKPSKVKSINGVSIVWLEEASEIKYSAYKEILGRIRTPKVSLHFILSLNPVDCSNWVYQHFFVRTDDEGNQTVILDDNRLYKLRSLVKNGVYYHHSVPEDNLFLPKSYIARLEEMQTYDPDLYRIARLGKFGVSGKRVLPQCVVAENHKEVMDIVKQLPDRHKFIGMDFGFVDSYNAIVRVAVDDKNKYLYIYWEYYKNNMTDLETVEDLDENHPWLKKYTIRADRAEPKTIKFYRDFDYSMLPCHKWNGSRLANTKKVKRFKKIIISPRCVNCRKELVNLSFKTDKNGNIVQDEFTFDPHTFSDIWYALDTYDVSDLKERKYYSKDGETW